MRSDMITCVCLTLTHFHKIFSFEEVVRVKTADYTLLNLPLRAEQCVCGQFVTQQGWSDLMTQWGHEDMKSFLLGTDVILFSGLQNKAASVLKASSKGNCCGGRVLIQTHLRLSLLVENHKTKTTSCLSNVNWVL